MLKSNSVNRIMPFIIMLYIMNNISYLRTMSVENMIEEAVEYKTVTDDESIHIDGIYDIDESCLINNKQRNVFADMFKLFSLMTGY